MILLMSCRRQVVSLIIVTALGLVLYACNGATAVNTPAQTPAASATYPPTAPATAPPSPTQPQPALVLLVPEGADGELAAALQPVLADVAAGSGLQFLERPSLSAADLGGEVKAVVALPPDAGLASLASAAPQTQFLAVGFPGLEPSENLTVIGSHGARPDQAAFLAGYLAAAITPDWRVGVISQAGTAPGQSARLGFTNGVFYFCGLCRPAYPPFPVPGYPVSAELPQGAGEADWQAAIASLQSWQVQTVYVDPGVAGEALYTTLAEAGFNLIGAGPPPPVLRDRWVASIGGRDLLAAIQEILPDLIRGDSGTLPGLSLGITQINDDLFSTGRQRLVEETLADLLAGFIDTGVDPATGEAR